MVFKTNVPDAEYNLVSIHWTDRRKRSRHGGKTLPSIRPITDLSSGNHSSTRTRNRSAGRMRSDEPLPPPPPPPPIEAGSRSSSKMYKLHRSSSMSSLSHYNITSLNDDVRTSTDYEETAVSRNTNLYDLVTLYQADQGPRKNENKRGPQSEKASCALESARKKEIQTNSRSEVDSRKASMTETGAIFANRMSDRPSASQINSFSIDPSWQETQFYSESISEYCSQNSTERSLDRDEEIKEQLHLRKASVKLKELKSPRPTSLFKPGQPNIFYPEHRVSFPINTGAIQRVAELHFKSQNNDMSSPKRPTLEDGRRSHRKRRPLPPIPREMRHMHDIDVMTPGFMEKKTIIFHDPITPLSATPLTLASTLTAFADHRDLFNSPRRGHCCYRPHPHRRKCKIALLLIPTLIAIATTTLFLLFFLGIIGTPQPTESKFTNHVTAGDESTLDSPNKGIGRNETTNRQSGKIPISNGTVQKNKNKKAIKKDYVTLISALPTYATVNDTSKVTLAKSTVKYHKQFDNGNSKKFNQKSTDGEQGTKLQPANNKTAENTVPASTPSSTTGALSHHNTITESLTTYAKVSGDDTKGNPKAKILPARGDKRKGKGTKLRNKSLNRRNGKGRRKERRRQNGTKQQENRRNSRISRRPTGGLSYAEPRFSESMGLPHATKPSMTGDYSLGSERDASVIRGPTTGPRRTLALERMGQLNIQEAGENFNLTSFNSNDDAKTVNNRHFVITNRNLPRSRKAGKDHDTADQHDIKRTKFDNYEYQYRYDGEGSTYPDVEAYPDDSNHDMYNNDYWVEPESYDYHERGGGNTMECRDISDPICDTILPYKMSLNINQASVTQLTMTSHVVDALTRKIREIESSYSSANETSQNETGCQLESALRFLCAVQNQKCTPDLPGYVEPPCKPWCENVLTSCLDYSTMYLTDMLRDRDVIIKNVAAHQQVTEKTTKPKIKKKRKNHDTRPRNKDKASLSEVASSTCDIVLLSSADATTSKCIDLSSEEKYMLYPDEGEAELYEPTVITQLATSEVPHCGTGYFLCVDGDCIDNGWRCDGYNDCGDWEDEKDCVCEYDEFQCSSGQCVLTSQVCDGFYDCFDKTDERNCDACGTNLTSCGDRQCVLSSWWCDGDVDCTNRRDESDCGCESQGLFTCDISRCIPLRYLCDSDRDCHDGTDEINCERVKEKDCDPWMMICNHSCMSLTKQCDGILDCRNGEDENQCVECEMITLEVCHQLTYNATMLPNFLGHLTQAETAMSSPYVMLNQIIQTRCHPLLKDLGCALLTPPVSINGATCPLAGKKDRRPRLLPCRAFCNEVMNSCISILNSLSLTWPSFLNCDQFPVKTNDSSKTCFDSENLNKGICASDEFHCVASSNGKTRCVTLTARCDGIEQCDDGSDEVDCDCDVLGRFQCASGNKCIDTNWVCDSHNDCIDGSDETNCDKCSSSQLPCSDYTCVSSTQWCDGRSDCKDGSDEANCLILVSRSQLFSSKIRQQSIRDFAHQSSGILLGYDSIASQWLPLCADSWDSLLSHLACNQMGYSDALSFKSVPFQRFGRSNHRSLKVVDNHRVRNVQETFLRGKQTCSTRRFINISCRPRSCGRRQDATDSGRILPRILGGRTSRDRKWPWMTSLRLPGMNHVCGATLVHSQWLISAAHCFQERNDINIWKASIIGNGMHISSELHNITKIVIHPRYDSQAVDFDIALVKLERPVYSRKLTPLCLPSVTFHSGSYCVVAGWGISGKSTKGAHKLQEGFVHVIKRSNCQRYYPNHVISNRMICAGHSGMVDACSGDSGGPLMCWQPHRLQWQLAGVTSWGSSCTPHSAPGVYTDVRYFSEWAERAMEQRDFG